MIPNFRIVQHAWVVPDAETAARRWFEELGVGPFLVARDLQLDRPQYRGQPGQPRFSIAVAQHGDTQIELIEQHCSTPSAYRDTVPAGATGYHHVAFLTDDYDRDVAHYTDRGYTVAAHGWFGPTRWAYVDTSATLGHMVEIVENTQAIRDFFSAVKSAGESWDGDPATLVRPIG